MYCPDKKIAQEILALYGSPTFVTSHVFLQKQVDLLKEALPKNGKIFYALKANYNPHILNALKRSGIDGVDTVSPFEIMLAQKCGFQSNEIIFTGNNSEMSELDYIASQGVLMNIGSISELERFAARHPGSRILLRFNPDTGAGETKQVVTGGKKSKFGIAISELEATQNIITYHKMKVIGIHSHIGSGFYKASIFKKAVKSIIKIASHFKGIEFLDLGGGFGVSYSPDSTPIDIKDFFFQLKSDLEKFERANGKPITIVIEPGKFLVAESTCLLTTVTDIKKGENTIFVGTNTGMNHIIRPALYGAHHHIVNLSSPDSPMKKITLVGNICESTDVIRQDIIMPMPKIGETLAILTSGAYCSSMSSAYNLRPCAAEVIIEENNKILLTRARQDFTKTFDGLGYRSL
jgi:diaminopimelate decarboxylase